MLHIYTSMPVNVLHKMAKFESLGKNRSVVMVRYYPTSFGGCNFHVTGRCVKCFNAFSAHPESPMSLLRLTFRVLLLDMP